MPVTIADIVGTYRLQFATGLVTGLAAGDTIFSARHTNVSIAARLKALEMEFITTTAFTAAQEVGWDAWLARNYSASPTGQTPIAIGTDGRSRSSYAATKFCGGTGDVRISNTGAITPGTLTLDGNAFARGSFWASAVGAQFAWRRHDFSANEPAGKIFIANEGFVIKNSIAMGATGVGRFLITLEWEDILLAN